MARGWESKSVESQQSGEDVGGAKRKVSVEEREVAAKRQSLELQMERVKRELETAVTPTHRAAKQNAVEYLQKELDALTSRRDR
ncbi:MAG TPA: hypothetical protein VE974_08915 [Thermoanaerobaculia bacterium]|nr:hypothetical protein [Thermoanaerobaculia bacterium]